MLSAGVSLEGNRLSVNRELARRPRPAGSPEKWQPRLFAFRINRGFFGTGAETPPLPQPHTHGWERANHGYPLLVFARSHSASRSRPENDFGAAVGGAALPAAVIGYRLGFSVALDFHRPATGRRQQLGHAFRTSP